MYGEICCSFVGWVGFGFGFFDEFGVAKWVVLVSVWLGFIWAIVLSAVVGFDPRPNHFLHLMLVLTMLLVAWGINNGLVHPLIQFVSF